MFAFPHEIATKVAKRRHMGVQLVLAGEPLVDCPANGALELRNAATISVLGSAAGHLSHDDSRRVGTQPVR